MLHGTSRRRGYLIGPRHTALSLAIASALALPMALHAQESPPPAPAEGEELETVVVTGFRQSLVSAIETKREATSVVEAVSAEDIGKLPESSIAESLARLPGVAGQRVNGRTSAISIRGFGQDFVSATMNGRELLGMGDNRGVEFDLYPSEIIAGATVYKSPTATLLTQGVAGTVDLQTTRPLSSPSTIAVNGMYEQNEYDSLNPDMDDNGYRGALTYVDQFMEDTIGVALSVATMESPSQDEWFEAWGYPTTDGDHILGGVKPYARSSKLNRDSYSAVVEWKPTDALHVTVDGLYIDYLDETIKRGLETPGAIWGTPNFTVLETSNGLVTQGSFDDTYVQIRNDSAEQDATLKSGGINIAYDINDTWTTSFDGAYSKVEKKISDLEIYSSFGRGEAGAGIVPDDVGFQMTDTGAVLDYSLPYDDYNLVKLAGAKNWGFDNPHCPGPDCTDDQDGFINFADFEETLTALRLQAHAKLEGGWLTGTTFGVNYSDREKSKVNTGLFLTNPAYPGSPPIPEQFRRGTVALDFLGGQRMVAIDGRGLYNSGYYLTYDEGDYKANRAADTWDIQEKVTTGYVQLDFAGDASDTPITGNIGLQYVYTDQSADGFGAQGSPEGVIAVPISDGTTYSDVLPSLNLAFALNDDMNIRFAAARTMSRTRLDKMQPGASIVFNPGNNIPTADLERSPWSATSGNPQLEPIKQDQLDLSYEWFFAPDGYLQVGMFNKHLVSWQTTAKVPTDFSQFYYPELGTVYTFDGYTETTVESGGGNIFGTEVQFALPFNVMLDALDGFGLIGYYTHLDNGVKVNGSEASIIGLSDESYGFTGYFEKWGFSARVNWNYRSEYTAEVRGGNNGLSTTQVLETELLDAQVGYDFGQAGFSGPLEGLSLFLSGSNLDDEPYVQFDNNDPRQIKRYSSYGANYQLGFRYKF